MDMQTVAFYPFTAVVDPAQALDLGGNGDSEGILNSLGGAHLIGNGADAIDAGRNTPNDLDYYEGRYGIEDPRQAILEARWAGLTMFGITVARRGQNYFPYLFGRSGYAIVSRLERFPKSYPAYTNNG